MSLRRAPSAGNHQGRPIIRVVRERCCIDRDHASFPDLKRHKAGLKRIGLSGWYEMENIRRRVDRVRAGLDVVAYLEEGVQYNGDPLVKDNFATVNNPVEWTLLLSCIPVP
jgi:hypothetical protein